MLYAKKISLSLLLFTSVLEAHSLLQDITSPDQLRNIKHTILVGTALESRRDLGKLGVHRDEHGYNVFNDKKELHRVQPHNMDKELCSMTPETLAKITAAGAYLSINKKSDGEYTLALKDRLRGGGPVTGWCAYWATKILCYGAAGAAAGTIVVGTGGTAGAVSALASGTAMAGAGAGGVAAGTVAGAITGAGLAAEATIATAAVVTEAAAAGMTAVAYVEAGSAAVGAFFTAIPFLP